MKLVISGKKQLPFRNGLKGNLIQRYRQLLSLRLLRCIIWLIQSCPLLSRANNSESYLAFNFGSADSAFLTLLKVAAPT
jgi:hypothetical protein